MSDSNSTPAAASLTAFGAELIDYAGLFPPSKLPMEQAVPNFLAYRTGARSGMLGRFIVPVGRLGELEPFADHLRAAGESGRVRFAVLPRGGDDPAAFATAFAEDLAQIRSFVDGLDRRVDVDTLEMRLPGTLATALAPDEPDPGAAEAAVPALKAWLQATIDAIVGSLPAGEAMAVYVELPYREANAAAWQGYGIRTLIDAIASIDTLPPAVANLGAKVRCGGTAPPPSIEDLQAAIAASVEGRVSLKFTAGLHHALPAEGRPGYPHGYANVFAATVIAHAVGYDADRTAAILRDTDPAAFHFTADALRWHDLAVATPDVARTRSLYVISFGSCDFIEPTSELLGLPSA